MELATLAAAEAKLLEATTGRNWPKFSVVVLYALRIEKVVF